MTLSGPRAALVKVQKSRIMHRAGAASDLTPMFGPTALTGQHPGDDVSRVEQDGFVLRRRDLDEA